MEWTLTFKTAIMLPCCNFNGLVKWLVRRKHENRKQSQMCGMVVVGPTVCFLHERRGVALCSTRLAFTIHDMRAISPLLWIQYTIYKCYNAKCSFSQQIIWRRYYLHVKMKDDQWWELFNRDLIDASSQQRSNANVRQIQKMNWMNAIGITTLSLSPSLRIMAHKRWLW